MAKAEISAVATGLGISALTTGAFCPSSTVPACSSSLSSSRSPQHRAEGTSPGRQSWGCQAALPPAAHLLPAPSRTACLHPAWATKRTPPASPPQGSETSLGKDTVRGPGDAGGGNVPGRDTGCWAGQVLARARGLEELGW